MKKNRTPNLILALTATLVGLTTLASVAYASGHFLSGLQNQYPAYDLNDTYVFESSNDGHTTFISSANPSAPGSDELPPVLFGQDGLYNMHISQDGEFKTGMTLAFSFEGKNVLVHQIGAPNAAVGEKGKLLGAGTVGETVTLPNGIRVWTGRGQDPFFGIGRVLPNLMLPSKAVSLHPNCLKRMAICSSDQPLAL